MFEVIFSSQAAKFLKKSDRALAKRVIEKIESLKTDPWGYGAKKIVGKDKLFRIRVGDYRVLYTIISESKTILIDKIDKRSRVYG